MVCITVWCFTPTTSPMILLAFAGRGREGQIRMRIRIRIRGVCKNSRGRGWEEGFQKVVRAVWALRLYSVARDKDIVEWAHRQQGRCWVSCPPRLAHAALLRTSAYVSHRNLKSGVTTVQKGEISTFLTLDWTNCEKSLHTWDRGMMGTKDISYFKFCYCAFKLWVQHFYTKSH